MILHPSALYENVGSKMPHMNKTVRNVTGMVVGEFAPVKKSKFTCQKRDYHSCDNGSHCSNDRIVHVRHQIQWKDIRTEIM